MRTKIATVALVGSLGLTGAALLSPSLASAQTPPAPTVVSDGLGALRDALTGLVGQDVLTQAQADRVAVVLAEKGVHAGRGGRGGHGPQGGRVSPQATAEAAGATVAELQVAREAGQTLAQLAQAHGVSRTTLTSRLVAAAETQLDADVTAGRLTRAQADEVRGTLTARVAEKVDRVGGPRGHGGRRARGDGDSAARPSSPASPSAASPSAASPSAASPSA